MKKKSIIVLLVLIILLIGGGIVVWKLSSGKEKSTSSNQQKNNPPATPLNKLSDQELEKCLLEDFSRRLELKDYFVFSLQKELKPEKCYSNLISGGGQLYFGNGKNFVPSLSRHLSKLLGKQKKFIAFRGKYTNSPASEEWKEDKLDQKVNNGEEWYIIFDKRQINSDTCNYFANSVWMSGREFPGGVLLAVESEPEVQIKKSKKEALEFLKNNDSALSSKS